MLVIYAKEGLEDLEFYLKSEDIPYTKRGQLIIAVCEDVEFIASASSMPEKLRQSIKIVRASQEDIQIPDRMLELGFKSTFLDDFLEVHLYNNLSSTLGSSETYFQAIIDVKAKDIYGFEALCRAQVPVYKLFKVSDRVAHLTDHFCREKALLEYRRRGLTRFNLFLNFHPKFLRNPIENVGEIISSLEVKNITPSRIVMEIDEYEGMNLSSLRMIRDFMKVEGVKVALDDVGAGYSGLYQLTEIKPDIAKLDMQLVRDVHSNSMKRAVVRGLVKACKEAGIKVLAEGVEKQEELEFLLSMEVDYLQGFYFAKPTPYPDLESIKERASSL
ncbi:MAG: EAL domain-containing protein [Aquificaceae bacterium]